jgi:hypothetical protein
MNALILAGLLVLGGLAVIVAGIALLAGAPWALIASGVAALILALVMLRGVRRV